MNAAREPLAALVAAWRDAHEAALAVCHDVGRAKYHREALRLLAAVEAGQKCADAIATVLRSGPDAITGGRAEFRGIPERGVRGSAITVSFDEMRAALAEWERVAEPERKCPQCGGPLTKAQNSEGWRCAPCKTLVA